MRGAKPIPDNVIPMMKGSSRRLAPAVLARRLCPRGLTKEERREWMRVATLLADPTADRLKPLFVDTITEYCAAIIRLRALRNFFRDHKPVEDEGPLSGEIYEILGRNGAQLKSHPHVAQLNETWRQWRSLMMELGLSPASERNMLPGQGDLFTDNPAAEFYG